MKPLVVQTHSAAASVRRRPAPERSSSSSPPSVVAASELKPAEEVPPNPDAPHRRKGHFKSRTGCFNCKRRKIKCQEQRPRCSSCARVSLVCEYPVRGKVTTGAPSMPLQTTGSNLNMIDLRFFHQFLTIAYPTLPLNAEAVWAQCAAMSHEHEYLAHALLGLGATHLSRHGNVDYTEQAVKHRLAALAGLKQRLSRPITSSVEGDALFAATSALASQAALMPNAMVEYLTMTRGIHLLIFHLAPNFYQKTLFRTFRLDGHLESLTKLIHEQELDVQLLSELEESLRLLEPLCETAREGAYLGLMQKIVRVVPESGFEAWKEYVWLYVMPAIMEEDEFRSFVHPENHIGRLLIFHGFLLEYVLGRYLIDPNLRLRFPARKDVVVSWIETLGQQLPKEYDKYFEWPNKFCRTLAASDSRYLLSF
ncbi:hypothetical protein GQ53DRAFT_630618 [Thozetella sp. PMI_491]|nr:hypothetical protein GQ53DRAFT_630618 [Thozetella sp. PMI_491]